MDVVLIAPEAMREKPGPYATLLREAGFDVRYPRNPTFTRGLGGEEEAMEELRGVSAVLAGGGEPYSARVLAALPQLRVIARAGVGYDRVEVAAATRHGIAVTITPTANHEAVAEHTLCLLLALAKGLVRNDQRTRQGHWRTDLTRPVRGATLGIVGLGRIGRSVAVRAVALGLRIVAVETHPDSAFVARHGIELVTFDELLSRGDYVTLHCPLTPETSGLFNRNTFARMKPGALLINTARGGLVVEQDLYAALTGGQLGGAGLDVFEVEPTTSSNPLFQLDNVVITPHIASSDTLSVENMGVEAAQCIATLRRNAWPTGAVVNAELRASWRWERSAS